MAKQTFTTGQVLTSAEMTALQLNDYNQTVSAKVANYVLAAADAGTRITMSNAGATTITVNTSLFTAGDTVYITNIGAGASTITAGTASVSTASSLVLAQYDSGTLYFTSAGVSIWQKYQGAAAAGGATYVGCSVSNTVSQSISNATETTITFNTEQWDTDSIHDTSSNTGRFTVPAGKTGKWRLSGSLNVGSSPTAWQNSVFINGTQLIAGLGNFAAITGFVNVMPISLELNLTAADYVELKVYQNSGGAADIRGQYSRVNFSYIGA